MGRLLPVLMRLLLVTIGVLSLGISELFAPLGGDDGIEVESMAGTEVQEPVARWDDDIDPEQEFPDQEMALQKALGAQAMAKDIMEMHLAKGIQIDEGLLAQRLYQAQSENQAVEAISRSVTEATHTTWNNRLPEFQFNPTEFRLNHFLESQQNGLNLPQSFDHALEGQLASNLPADYKNVMLDVWQDPSLTQKVPQPVYTPANLDASASANLGATVPSNVTQVAMMSRPQGVDWVNQSQVDDVSPMARSSYSASTQSLKAATASPTPSTLSTSSLPAYTTPSTGAGIPRSSAASSPVSRASIPSMPFTPSQGGGGSQSSRGGGLANMFRHIAENPSSEYFSGTAVPSIKNFGSKGGGGGSKDYSDKKQISSSNQAKNNRNAQDSRKSAQVDTEQASKQASEYETYVMELASPPQDDPMLQRRVQTVDSAACWKVSSKRDLFVRSPDGTDYQVMILARATAPVRVLSSCPVELKDQKGELLNVNEGMSVRTGTESMKPVVLTCKGDNVIRIKNVGGSEDTTTVFVQAVGPVSRVGLRMAKSADNKDAVAAFVAKDAKALGTDLLEKHLSKEAQPMPEVVPEKSWLKEAMGWVSLLAGTALGGIAGLWYLGREYALEQQAKASTEEQDTQNKDLKG